MENQTQDTAQDTLNDRAPELGQTFEELQTVGRIWAGHGLRIGAAALQTSAATLAHTANVLVSIASGVDPTKEQ
jgi:hypothetical protein